MDIAHHYLLKHLPVEHPHLGIRHNCQLQSAPLLKLNTSLIWPLVFDTDLTFTLLGS
jgi:hypothetical protein